MTIDTIQDAVVSNTVRIAVSEFAFERLTLGGIAFKVIYGLGEASVEKRFPLSNFGQDALCPMGEFYPITWQGSA